MLYSCSAPQSRPQRQRTEAAGVLILQAERCLGIPLRIPVISFLYLVSRMTMDLPIRSESVLSESPGVWRIELFQKRERIGGKGIFPACLLCEVLVCAGTFSLPL